MAQKTVLQIAQTITNQIGIPTPQAVVSANDQNMAKLLAVIRSACEDLLQEYDWQVLQRRYTFQTTSGVDNYALPSDQERFINATFYDQNNRWPMQGQLTATEWELIKASNLAASPFERYRVLGNKLYLFPTPSSNAYTFVYEYISSAYCTSSAGVPQIDIQQDSDIILLDHRMVVYGAKVKWLTSIGMDTSAALAEFDRAVELAKGTDVPGRKLSIVGGLADARLIGTANLPDTGYGGIN